MTAAVPVADPRARMAEGVHHQPGRWTQYSAVRSPEEGRRGPGAPCNPREPRGRNPSHPPSGHHAPAGARQISRGNGW